MVANSQNIFFHTSMLFIIQFQHAKNEQHACVKKKIVLGVRKKFADEN